MTSFRSLMRLGSRWGKIRDTVVFSLFSAAVTMSGSPSNPHGSMMAQVERYFPWGVKLGSAFVWNRAQTGMSTPSMLPLMSVTG